MRHTLTIAISLLLFGAFSHAQNSNDEIHMRATVQAVVPLTSFSGKPQGSPQKRPMRVTSKPANGRGRGLSCFTLQLPVQASLILYANSADRILGRDHDGEGDQAWR
jgi:hypothetical protein